MMSADQPHTSPRDAGRIASSSNNPFLLIFVEDMSKNGLDYNARRALADLNTVADIQFYYF